MANNIWPDTSFDVSMLNDGVIINCPEKDLAVELFEILSEHGVTWAGKESMRRTFWMGKTMCYRITKDLRMSYGSIHTYLGELCYEEYTKCTFYGASPELEISCDSFERIIFAGGKL